MDRWSCKLKVLASGSKGNCSVLTLPSGAAILIDAGLSPRRTTELLTTAGVPIDSVVGALFTHLDHDHAHAGWAQTQRGVPPHFRHWIHRRHMGRAERQGLLSRRAEPFADSFEIAGVSVTSVMVAHDDLGVAAFRFEFPSGERLGFATDLGNPRPELLDHFHTVDVLAIESNYCPRMQAASNRPDALKERIMSGGGHLSNYQARDAVTLIEPKRHVVLLHLSQECNTVDTVAAMHAGSEYELTISTQDEPTRWIGVAR